MSNLETGFDSLDVDALWDPMGAAYLAEAGAAKAEVGPCLGGGRLVVVVVEKLIMTNKLEYV